MTTTERWVNEVVEECLRESSGDSDIALAAADILCSVLPMPDEVEIESIDDPELIDAYFAHDIFNRAAQGILNRSLQAAKKLSATARMDLIAALGRDGADQGAAILKFIDRYRVQLAKLLTTTQLASLLEGAREVAAKVPTLADFPGAVPPPPTLEPGEAVALVDRLSALSGDARARAIYDLPPDQQTYVAQSIAVKEANGPAVPPRFAPSQPPAGSPEAIHLVTIDEAVKQLSDRNVMDRQRYDALDAVAHAKAFTVANVEAEETLTKLRDSLAENIKEGADYETWRKKIVADMDEGTFLSEAHCETVFRTNVQTAFSDGQEAVLSHPLVRSGFPYRVYDSIHDDRVREEHKDLDTLGIGGTNIYRADDPVWQTFRPPWSYNCRCSATPITVRYAAEKGIKEAQEWLASGVEPAEKAFVAMPDFRPPPGFQRAVASAPLSIRLSMQSVMVFAGETYATPSIQLSTQSEDEYPRNASNQFVDKFDIAEAARDADAYAELRESLPEDQRSKLDAMVGRLTMGGAVHHPKENPRLAVGMDGKIADPQWEEYADRLRKRDEWAERDADRAERRSAAKDATKLVRKATADLDGADDLLKTVATRSELRALAKMRYRAGAEKATTQELEDAYEEVIEAVHGRIDEEEDGDSEPDVPEKPDDIEAAFGPDSVRRGKQPGPNWVRLTDGPRGGMRWAKKGSSPAKDQPHGAKVSKIKGGGSKHRHPSEDDDARAMYDENIKRMMRGDEDDELAMYNENIERMMYPNGKPKRSDGKGGGPPAEQPPADGGRVEGAPARPGDAATGGVGKGADKPARAETTGNPETDRINARIDRYGEVFKKKGNAQAAEWMDLLKQHISAVGPGAALAALGEAKQGNAQRIQYEGAYDELSESAQEADFIKRYLDKAGITLVHSDSTVDPNSPLVSSFSAKNLEQLGRKRDPKTGDYVPTDQTFTNKLEESKHLPGLESSEDIDKVIGAKVTNLTPEIMAKFDAKYGKGQWIVKSYGAEAYAGFGIFFPQRAKQIRNDARAVIADSRYQLNDLGYKIVRGQDKQIVGISKGKSIYTFGTPEFDSLSKPVKVLGKQVAQAAHAENGAKLPTSPEDTIKNDYGISFRRDANGIPIGITNWDGKDYDFTDQKIKKIEEIDGGAAGYAIHRAMEADEWRRQGFSTEPKFMVQPAFKAVGVSDADRAMGNTWETAKEGRVHAVVRDGKATAVPYATLVGRGDSLPAVFASDDTRAMEKAVEDAINQLPESERTGQLYAPDVMKTKDGWKVLELNPSAEGGGSDWLGRNPFVIDALASHMTGREPAHVQFIRKLLKDHGVKQKVTPQPQPQPQPATVKGGVSLAVDATGHKHKGKGKNGGQFTGDGNGGDTVQHEPKTNTTEAAEITWTKKIAKYKIKNAPVPSPEAIAKARVELQLSREGKIRAGGESRGGSAASRRKQRENLFKEFRGEEKGYIRCHGCGCKLHHTPPPNSGIERLERGKIFVKCQGGGYQLPNLLPECFKCNRSRNDDQVRKDIKC